MTFKRKITILSIISIGAVVLCSILTIILSYILSYRYQLTSYEEVLISFATNRWIHSAETMINLFMGVTLFPAFLGIFFFLREEIGGKSKPLLFFPLIATIIGALLVVGLYSLKFYLIFSVATNYMAATNKEPILNYFLSLTRISDILSVIVYILVYTLGAGMTSILTIKTNAVKPNISWLGILTGVLALGKIGYFLENTAGYVLSFAASLGAIMYFIWLIYYFTLLINYRKEMQLFKEEPME